MEHDTFYVSEISAYKQIYLNVSFLKSLDF